MKVYFDRNKLVYFAASASKLTLPKHKARYLLIMRMLKTLGFELIENYFTSQILDKSLYKTTTQAVRSELRLVAKADFLVSEVTVPSFGVGTAIEQAIAQRKPVLCLYLNSADHEEVSGVFTGHYYNNLQLEYYDKNNIRKILKSAFSNFEDGTLSKFNFLVTHDIASYLDWVTSRIGKSKSEFLREEIVREIIKKDRDYQSYVSTKRPKKREQK